MKNGLLVLFFVSQNAFASLPATTVVLKETVAHTTVELNSETVRCSDVGYGNLQLKVTVPVLNDIALFNHSNPGENAPCVTAGNLSCGFGIPGEGGAGIEPMLPSKIIDPSKPTEEIDVKVVLNQDFMLNVHNNTCLTTLRENVETTIRGVKFVHFRSGVAGNFPVELCRLIIE